MTLRHVLNDIKTCTSYENYSCFSLLSYMKTTSVESCNNKDIPIVVEFNLKNYKTCVIRTA